MKTKVILSCLYALSIAVNAFALRIETGSDIRITEPVNEDIYLFGSNIVIDAVVNGDIWCAGGTVTISDTVRGDLVVAGGNIYMRGVVMDDIRAAGGTLIVSGSIVGDMIITGGTVTIDPGATVGGDLLISGGSATVNSSVQGKVKAAGSKVALNGSIGKDLEFNGGELTINGSVGGSSSIAATKLKIGDKATFKGNVRYWSDEGEVNFGNSIQSGSLATFDPSLRTHFERPTLKFLGFASFLGVMWYLIACSILIWLGQWLFAQTFRKSAATAQADPMRSLGYGFLYFAAVPVAIVVLFITIVGIPVGLIGLFFYILFFALANILAALVGAHWINSRKNYNWRTIQIVGVALGLLVLIKLVGTIPFIGWVTNAIVVLIAFGAILLNTRLFKRDQVTIPAA